MTDPKIANKILFSKNNLYLYGYKNYFELFIKMFENKMLPHTILLTGQKGIGKSTFVYHFVNFILSKNEKYQYSVDKHLIDENNLSYQFVTKSSHTNFFLLDSNTLDENIKIDQVRSLTKFLNKSTYLDDIKLILIDNADLLNINSSNALLKSLEEPKDNTYFFIISSNTKKILNTIKSRSIEFKFVFSYEEKKEILNKILKDNNFENLLNFPNDLLNYESHGNILRLISLLSASGVKDLNDYLSVVLFLMDDLLIKKNNELLPYLSLFIQLYYKKLSFKKVTNTNIYNYNKIKILKLIHNLKTYNLDKKNLHLTILGILNNG